MEKRRAGHHLDGFFLAAGGVTDAPLKGRRDKGQGLLAPANDPARRPPLGKALTSSCSCNRRLVRKFSIAPSATAWPWASILPCKSEGMPAAVMAAASSVSVWFMVISPVLRLLSADVRMILGLFVKPVKS